SFNTSSDFNRYRVTLSGDGVAALYINDSTTPLINGYTGLAVATQENRIYFGDPSNSTGGTVRWEYVAFTNAGSVPPPIPEGNVALLALIGGAFAMGGVRLVRRRPTATTA